MIRSYSSTVSRCTPGAAGGTVVVGRVDVIEDMVSGAPQQSTQPRPRPRPALERNFVFGRVKLPARLYPTWSPGSRSRAAQPPSSWPLPTDNCPLATDHSPLATPNSPIATRHSQLATH